MTTAVREFSAVTEKQLREQIRTLTKLFGWRMAFTQFSTMSPKGFPDLVLVRPPRLIFAELKSEKGKTTPEQDEWLADLRRSGRTYLIGDGSSVVVGEKSEYVEVYLWRPHDIELIAEVLR